VVVLGASDVSYRSRARRRRGRSRALRPRRRLARPPPAIRAGSGRRPRSPPTGAPAVAVGGAPRSSRTTSSSNVDGARQRGVPHPRWHHDARADEGGYDRTTSMAEVGRTGHVVVVAPRRRRGRRRHATHRPGDETGWIRPGPGDRKQEPVPDFETPGHIEKQAGPCYQVPKTVFCTTCRCCGIERPSWSHRGASRRWG